MGRLPAAEYERFCRRYGHEPDGTIPFRVAQDHYRKLAEQDPKAVRREWFRRYRPKEQAAQEQLRDRGNGQGFLFG
ncbi:MAG TPA: hypothetical protein VJB16_03290 [archaeon]|nr:hypothetical protein [archaeon]